MSELVSGFSLLYSLDKQIVIVKERVEVKDRNVLFWGPLSSKEVFLQNLCLYNCMFVCMYASRTTRDETTQSVYTKLATNITTSLSD